MQGKYGRPVLRDTARRVQYVYNTAPSRHRGPYQVSCAPARHLHVLTRQGSRLCCQIVPFLTELHCADCTSRLLHHVSMYLLTRLNSLYLPTCKQMTSGFRSKEL